jgi:hypothetical protein
MATKAGRVELKDIRSGKTLWKAGLNLQTGERFPERVFITHGVKRYKEGEWTYVEAYMGVSMGRLITLEHFPANHVGEPCFDKLFVSLSAVKRWIKRYECNRVETLCEDRRIFKYGSHFMRRSGIDLDAIPDNLFVSTEQWLVNEAKYERYPASPFNLFDAAQEAQKAA